MAIILPQNVRRRGTAVQKYVTWITNVYL